MNPYWTQFLRRHWQVLAALGLFAGLAVVHVAIFQPALGRYRGAVAQATRLGIPLDASGAAPAPSAQTVALLDNSSLSPEAAEEQGSSGALTAGLLGEITRLAARRGLEVLSTEQGLVTQLPGSVVVRAHLRLAGGYARFVGLLDDLARDGTLICLDRFTIEGTDSGRGNIEVWVSRIVLKRTGALR